MKLRNLFVLVLAGSAIVAPLVFHEDLSLSNAHAAAPTASASAANVGCNASCQNGVMRLMDAYNQYEDRKKGRDARGMTGNDKGLSVISMVQAKLNNRPAFLASLPV